MMTIIKQRIMKHAFNLLQNPYEDNSLYYFGYGANLDPDYFLSRFPGAKIIGSARLDNYRFEINVPCEYVGKGFGGIQLSKDDYVYGTLYFISKSSFRLLNVLEWVPFNFYVPKIISVNSSDQIFEAIVYEPCFPKDKLKTSLGYKKMLITGAKKMDFPDAYIQFLESLPTSDNFELDHAFNLSSPGCRRCLNSSFYKIHDKIREKLCDII